MILKQINKDKLDTLFKITAIGASGFFIISQIISLNFQHESLDELREIRWNTYILKEAHDGYKHNTTLARIIDKLDDIRKKLDYKN